MKNKSASIPGFDLLKFLMALMIVAIHANPFRNSEVLYLISLPFTSSAVPVFFLISSFFLFRKSERFEYDFDILKHWAMRICAMYCFWGFVNLPFIIADRLEWGG